MKDWHLTAAVLVIVGIIVLMTILSAGVPLLRPDLILRPDKERPQGKTVSDDILLWLHYIKIT